MNFRVINHHCFTLDPFKFITQNNYYSFMLWYFFSWNKFYTLSHLNCLRLHCIRRLHRAPSLWGAKLFLFFRFYVTRTLLHCSTASALSVNSYAVGPPTPSQILFRFDPQMYRRTLFHPPFFYLQNFLSFSDFTSHLHCYIALLHLHCQLIPTQ